MSENMKAEPLSEQELAMWKHRIADHADSCFAGRNTIEAFLATIDTLKAQADTAASWMEQCANLETELADAREQSVAHSNTTPAREEKSQADTAHHVSSTGSVRQGECGIGVGSRSLPPVTPTSAEVEERDQRRKLAREIDRFSHSIADMAHDPYKEPSLGDYALADYVIEWLKSEGHRKPALPAPTEGAMEAATQCVFRHTTTEQKVVTSRQELINDIATLITAREAAVRDALIKIVRAHAAIYENGEGHLNLGCSRALQICIDDMTAIRAGGQSK